MLVRVYQSSRSRFGTSRNSKTRVAVGRSKADNEKKRWERRRRENSATGGERGSKVLLKDRERRREEGRGGERLAKKDVSKDSPAKT